MNKDDLKKRLKEPAVRTGRLCLKLPPATINKIYTGQTIRSSAPSASNYRAACRGKSKADFINKLSTVEEELDETMFFYEMIAEFNPEHRDELKRSV